MHVDDIFFRIFFRLYLAINTLIAFPVIVSTSNTVSFYTDLISSALISANLRQ